VRRQRVGHFHSEKLLLAGRTVPAGAYREVESGRVVVLDTEERLPASLDGRVACYLPLTSGGRNTTDTPGVAPLALTRSAVAVEAMP
jgi:hypothetical protein